MKAQDVLADAVLQTKMLTGRFIAGFDDATGLRQQPAMPNHVVWNLGHLAITMHRCIEKITGRTGVPESDFVSGGTPGGGGDAKRFAIESVSFGSAPTSDARAYPGMARAVEIFNNAVERLASEARALPDAELAATVAWGMNQTTTKKDLVLRMVFHNGFHTGQVSDLRRAMGFKSAFV